MSGRGRPAKLDGGKEKLLVKLASEGLHKQTCAWEAGIGVQTLEDWLRKGEQGDPKYREFARAFRVAEAKAEHKLVRRLSVLAGGRKGNERPVVEFLKRRWPKRWGDKAVFEQSGLDGGPIKHEITPAEIQAKVAARFGAKVARDLTGPGSEDDSKDS